MRIGILLVAVLSAAAVWFWPEVRVYLLQHGYMSEVVAAIDDGTDRLPKLRGFQTSELTGRVVGVDDGDTITLLTPQKTRLRVRLAEIDAPESGQPWGRHSKEVLSSLVYSQSVRVVSAGLDRYGRTLGRVFVRGKDINAEMVRSGDAHAYRQYLTDKGLILVEDEAREAKRGLWSLAAAQTQRPWEWRRESRRDEDGVSTVQAAASTGRGACARKRFCREMSSCAEARYYLNSCGRRSLDGDRDGVPCEMLCRGGA